MVTAQVLEKYLSAGYSEMNYIIFPRFRCQCEQKMADTGQNLHEIYAWSTSELEKTSVKMFLLVFSELAYVIF